MKLIHIAPKKANDELCLILNKLKSQIIIIIIIIIIINNNNNNNNISTINKVENLNDYLIN